MLLMFDMLIYPGTVFTANHFCIFSQKHTTQKFLMAVGILLPFVCVSKVKTDLMLFPDAHKIKGNDTDLF